MKNILRIRRKKSDSNFFLLFLKAHILLTMKELIIVPKVIKLNEKHITYKKKKSDSNFFLLFLKAHILLTMKELIIKLLLDNCPKGNQT